MSLSKPQYALLALAVIGLLGGAVSFDAAAQDSGDRSEHKSGKQEVLYPNASRQEPEQKSSRKLASKEQKLIDSFNKAQGADDDAKSKELFAQVRSQADEVLASPDAGAYDKSLAAQVAAQAAYTLDDSAAAKNYLQQAIDDNGLGNNGHYQSMFMLAQLQLQDEQYPQGLATLDRYLSETKSSKPEEIALKGQALYLSEKYAEAIPVLKQAIAATSEPKQQWVQMLMSAYDQTDQPAEALKLAEQLAAKSPDDTTAQFNLAAMYTQNDQTDKAAAILEKLRASGKLTDERGYKQLYITYANIQGREKDTIAVINEGFSKGILKPDDYQANLALAQAYYYSDPPQIDQAVAAWQKAAPLSQDGETYLNLAKVLYQEQRLPEAKAAAQKALDKGVKKPQDAQAILKAK
ncbi:MAG: tetratricopeptide repeat protein [Pseudoxanthomonas sp.]